MIHSDNGAMTTGEAPAPLTSDLIAAVRSALLREVARVDDPLAGVPGGDPSDVTGWHPYTRPGDKPSSSPGRPYYDAEAWRWFRLIDIAVLDNSVFVKFAWDEPDTPRLEYLGIVPVYRYTRLGAAGAALLVRSHMRDLLAPLDALESAASNSTPGWRNRVSRTWLGPNFVLVTQPTAESSPSDLDRAWANTHPGPVTD